MNELIKDIVATAMGAKFPEYKVLVRESHDDDDVLCVYVFGVLKKDLRDVTNFVLDLHDVYEAKFGVLITPMVKDLETTERYYQEHMPTTKPVSSARVLARVWLDSISEELPKILYQNLGATAGAWDLMMSDSISPVPTYDGFCASDRDFFRYLDACAKPAKMALYPALGQTWKVPVKEEEVHIAANKEYELAA
jgi:hypothetical protein